MHDEDFTDATSDPCATALTETGDEEWAEVRRAPLSQVPFVVVDLETTGGRPTDSHITEIGAVKVRGGEVLGEFHTLVDPGVPVPPFIRMLTGITDEMLLGAPRIESVIPAFLEFSRGCVLVAHNAPFDIGFLRASTRALGLAWPSPPVVDTVTLARRLVSRDEVPNHKLGTLAAHFGADTTPDHRALHDARATVDVLHALFARAGSAGPWAAESLEDLERMASHIRPVQRAKRHLADGLPEAPGAYMFLDSDGRVLLVGHSGNIRRRVASYFTAAEQRARITEMLTSADRVVAVPCSTHLEAQVRRIRLVAEHRPPYNRRSEDAPNPSWIKLTSEPFPRLSVVSRLTAGTSAFAGPFPRRSAAVAAVEVLQEAVPIRRCTTRLARKSARAAACALAEAGRCGAPCTGQQNHASYQRLVRRLEALLKGTEPGAADTLAGRQDVTPKVAPGPTTATESSARQALLDGLGRGQRLAPVSRCPEIVAARRRTRGGWEVVDIRYGRLAGTVLTPAGEDPVPYIAALRASAETVPEPSVPFGAAVPAETEALHEWLARDGVRLVDLVGAWSCPVGGADGAGRSGIEYPGPTPRDWLQ